MRGLAVGLALISSSCMTIEDDTRTADGQIIPGRKFLQFSEYEYVCVPTHGKNHREMETLLDRYGEKGWQLGGFIQKEGSTVAFCMQR